MHQRMEIEESKGRVTGVTGSGEGGGEYKEVDSDKLQRHEERQLPDLFGFMLEAQSFQR